MGSPIKDYDNIPTVFTNTGNYKNSMDMVVELSVSEKI